MGSIVSKWPPESRSVIVVTPCPAPMMEMPIPLGTVIPLVQVQEPAGILMVSPLTAVCLGPLIIAFTSDRLQDAAVKVPCAFADGARRSSKTKKKTTKRLTSIFILPAFPIRYRTLSPEFYGAQKQQ